jgi:subtilase family serine protease
MKISVPLLRRAVRPSQFAACLLSLATLGSAFLTSQAQTPVRRLSAVPDASAARVALPNSMNARRLAGAEALGELPGDTAMMGMKLYLKPTAAQQADLDQLVADQQNPASPSYHHWLTPAQYGTRFGVADADLAVLKSWLQARGFSVDDVTPSRNFITFSGTASAVDSAFGVSMQRYRRNGREFRDNNGDVNIPAALADVVGGVTGLSTYRLQVPQARHMALPQSSGLSPQYTTSSGNSHYLVPWDFRQIYDLNTLFNAGNTGSGIKIGIIGQSAVNTTQLADFQAKTGQTANLPNMVLVPNTGASNLIYGDEGESELDLEYASGTAPGASVQFIYTGCSSTSTGTVLNTSANCNNNGVFDALTYAVTYDLAPILSLSYGGCEAEFQSFATSTAGGNTPFESVLQQANTQGQTILVSSGDDGAASCETASAPTVATGGLSVSYPASSSYVTAVGGTTINSDASNYWALSNNSYGGSAISYIPEVAWNDTASYGSFSASGGGASALFSRPSWQAGTGVPAGNHRFLPDVSFPANVAEHGYLVCSADAPCTGTSGWGGSSGGGLVGGTSAAAPNFAAMLAIIEQANGGGALGNINPSLYSLASGTGATTIFHDITSGNNIVACIR